MKIVISGVLWLLCIPLLFCQDDYQTLEEIESHLREVVRANPGLASLESLAKSPGNKDVWLLRLGQGDEELTPGIFFLGGVDGTHPAGSHLVIGLIDKLLQKASDLQQNPFEDFLFYFVPVFNPDAYAQYHSDLRYEREGNARETDTDRDGRVSEDPYDDLDGNGLITVVRIEDPTGDYTLHSEDDRVMVPLKDRSGATSIYRLISEGIDNDKDGSFNEDGPGGINLNKNFSFNYAAFQPGSGDHAVSEVENQMLAEFLFARWNIHTVFSFTRENNLVHPIPFDRNKVNSRIISGLLEGDAAVGLMVSKTYNQFFDEKSAPKMSQGPGSFSSWAYFHYGRFSYVSPAWWPAAVDQSEVRDSLEKKSSRGTGKSPSGDNYDLSYIKWAESNGVEDFFVPWTEIDHPDFVGRKAEVGGFKPFVRHNPPVGFLSETIDSHFVFLTTYLSKMPKLEFQDVRVEQLENRVFRIRGKVVNTGHLPTNSELGDRTRWVRDIRNRILLSDGQELLVGSEREFHKSLKPGEFFEFSWLVSGRGEIRLEAAHPMTIDDSLKLDLR